MARRKVGVGARIASADLQMKLVVETAATMAYDGRGDELIVVPEQLAGRGDLSGISQTDDGVTAVAAIDVLRLVVEMYEEDDDEGE